MKNIFFLLPLLVPAQTVQAGEPKRLNVISIVTDDQARWALGCYGNRDVRTPNMDRLAREGALFKNAFVATPVCSPSRASFMTGKYGTQVGITDWIEPKEAAKGVGLPEHAVPWPAVLKRAGYVTGLIGKWHLGTLERFHPTKRGFDHFFGFTGGGNVPIDPTLEREGKTQKLKGSLPDILVDDAIDFVRTNQDKPFALCLHFREPHAPYAPTPKEDSDPFKNLEPTLPKYPDLNLAKVKQLTLEYYASIHSIDRNLGRLFAELDKLGLLENTIILFTSDHGYNIGHHGIWHKGNGNWILNSTTARRPNMYETSLAVPLLIRWPGVVKGGTQIDPMVSNIDTFVSVLSILKVPPPEGYRHEGKDFTPLLRGAKVPWRDAVFFQYDLHNGPMSQMRSVRTERWHLVRQYLDNKMPNEFFDLQNDLGEEKNLFDDPAHRAVRDELQARLTLWMRSVEGPITKK
jgi:choline-sulfatase